MIQRIGNLLEVLSALLCIHTLYGKRFRLNIKNIIVVALDLILIQLIAEGKLPQILSIMMCVLVSGYCIAEFGLNKCELIINTILYIVIITVLQVLSYELLIHINVVRISNAGNGFNNLWINLLVFLIVWIVFPHMGFRKFSLFMQQKIMLLRTILVMGFVLVIYMILVMKAQNYLAPEHYVIITISLCLIWSVTYMWQKNQYKVKEQKIELQMHRMYDEGFQNLVTEVRRRQHDFQNHLNTIYSLHYTCNTLEELVQQQKAYMDAIQEDNQYNKLLSTGNPVIIGFLYGKFLQADKRGIAVIYKVKVENLEGKMPIHKLVEIIGNLFDNAMEAIEEQGVEPKIYLDFIETPDKINLKVKNESCYITQEKLLKMFERGESSKGEARGLGLANVKQICEEYKCDLQANNRKDEQNKSYMEFEITLNKEHS
ncbi:MAG: GHKL domain-containing protein [Lachnospiraceae bacterium]|nr:GHKL domain-containing protein [Lachnospiraceae bacterium]